MNEPLFWNPLPTAAEWLSKRTGREIDALTLVDIVASMGKQGDGKPTIIKAMLPRELQFAAITLHGNIDPNQTKLQRFISEQLAKRFGPLPVVFDYVKAVYPTVSLLSVNCLLDILMHGNMNFSVLMDTPTSNPNHYVCAMPWGTVHRATVETCGINRADLLALGDLLATKAASEPQAAPVVPVVETKEQRQNRRLKACEAAGLTMPSVYPCRLPNGVADVADREGVTRQAFSTDIKAALQRREAIAKPGRIVRIT